MPLNLDFDSMLLEQRYDFLFHKGIRPIFWVIPHDDLQLFFKLPNPIPWNPKRFAPKDRLDPLQIIVFSFPIRHAITSIKRLAFDARKEKGRVQPSSILIVFSRSSTNVEMQSATAPTVRLVIRNFASRRDLAL